MGMIERFLNHRWSELAVACEWLGLAALLAMGRPLFGSEQGRSSLSLSPRVFCVVQGVVGEPLAGGRDSRASALAWQADPGLSGLADSGSRQLGWGLSCG
jgi:hypothetical protein